MSENPYESPAGPSKPRVVDKRAIYKRLGPWVVGGIVLAAIAAPFIMIRVPGARHAPMGALSLSFGLITGPVLVLYWIVRSILIEQAPSLNEEDESDWLPR
jgi:hypothetical protein